MCSLLTTLVSLGVYALTLKREVGWGDGAELALQAYQLGVTHPPGYPVHTILGKTLGLLIAEPAVATNTLSAVCTAASAGLLSLMIYRITAAPLVSILAPLVYAFSPRLWSMAVQTEVYNVNVLFWGLALFSILAWQVRPSRANLVFAAAIFAVSLGTSLANLLLLPAFAVVLARSSKPAAPNFAIFAGIVGLLGALVLGWSVLRWRSFPPMGTLYPPDSFENAIRYFSGAQYESTALHSAGFYVTEALRHSKLFVRDFLRVGVVLGVFGFFGHWRLNRTACLALAIVLAINAGYFSGYMAKDSHDMLTPSYFVFAIWIGLGAHALTMSASRRLGAAGRAISPLLLSGMVLALLATQLTTRLDRADARPVTDFARSSFTLFAEDSVVAARWGRFASLVYFQRTGGLRPDLTIVERSTERRHYLHGTVESYVDLVVSAVEIRPVFVDDIEHLSGDRRFRAEAVSDRWYRIWPGD